MTKIPLVGLLRRLLLALIVTASSHQAHAERIVSIGGSTTEIVYALEASEHLIARDSSSLYPTAAQTLPDVGYMRALAAEPIVSLAPSLVLIEEGSGPPETIAKLKAVGLPLVVIPNKPSLTGVIEKIASVADAIGKQEAGDALIQELTTLAGSLSIPLSPAVRPSALFVLSFDPGSALVAGAETSANAMIELAGGRNLAAGFSGYKPVGGEAIAQMKPDYIITTHRAIREIGGIEKVRDLPAIATLPSMTKEHIVAMDALLLLGLGPRTVEGVQKLALGLNTLE